MSAFHGSFYWGILPLRPSKSDILRFSAMKIQKKRVYPPPSPVTNSFQVNTELTQQSVIDIIIFFKRVIKNKTRRKRKTPALCKVLTISCAHSSLCLRVFMDKERGRKAGPWRSRLSLQPGKPREQQKEGER